MPRSKNAGRNANGLGNIRKKHISADNGTVYEYWEARVTVGFDPGTGKQLQRSITGKTQKEVTLKMKEISVDVDKGIYIEPSKQTLGEWLDAWYRTYLGNVKPRTLLVYKSDIDNHIKPAMGALRLEAINTQMIQSFYNSMQQPSKKHPQGLSPKTIKNVHGVLHKAFQQAVLIGYLRFNPADACILPRVEKKELKPFDEDDITNFLKALQGHPFQDLYIVTLFTGMREGEVLGLTWDCVNFPLSSITINKQMQLHQEAGINAYKLVSTKNGRPRSVTAPPFVMAALKRRKAVQAQQKLMAGESWCNPDNLVFTNDIGQHLTKPTVYRAFKQLAASIGRPEARFHDLRHSYAVAAIRSGDDIKTVQENLGHATAAFTLDVYGHVTDKMKQESANRMERFIQSVYTG